MWMMGTLVYGHKKEEIPHVQTNGYRYLVDAILYISKVPD